MTEGETPQQDAALLAAPVEAGESFGRRLRYSAAQIADFARMSLDANPLHLDRRSARLAGYDDVIASGQQSTAMMMGLVATHFSRQGDGAPRELLCLNFNFAFKAPIQAGQEIDMRWTVSEVNHNQRLDGWIGQLNGTAACAGIDCVVARGTVLVRQRD